jgi:hypothetical protein
VVQETGRGIGEPQRHKGHKEKIFKPLCLCVFVVKFLQESYKMSCEYLLWRSILLFFLVVVCLPSALAQTGSRITIASGVKLRKAPQVSAEEVVRLQIGTVLRELEKSSSKEKINQVEDYWYKVALQNGKEGWVFGGFTTVFYPDKWEEIYRRIVTERLKMEISFGDCVDLINFLESAVLETSQKEVSADLEFSLLRAMKRAVSLIPIDKQEQPTYQSWIKAQEKNIVYSEPAGQWFVRSELFWNLQKRYSSLPIADEIAWEGANNPLPGECEGYLPCHIHLTVETLGNYLKLYPSGVHAEEALKLLTEELQPIVEDLKEQKIYETSKEDYAGLQKDIAALRAVVVKTTGRNKTQVLNQLDQIAKRYR